MAKKKASEKKPWIFTKDRRVSIKKAQREHIRLVKLGRGVRGY
jgi:hypothetical protein